MGNERNAYEILLLKLFGKHHAGSEEGDGRMTLIRIMRGVGCKDGRWMQLARNCVRWCTSVPAVLNLLVQLPLCYYRVVCICIPKNESPCSSVKLFSAS